MSIIIGDYPIEGMFVGDTMVDSVYVGDIKVYGDGTQIEPPVVIPPEKENIDTSYNYFVFDTSKVKGTTKVVLSGDTRELNLNWDRLTDWGDGIINTNTTHRYVIDGEYMVKTKYSINTNANNSGDSNTRKMLVKCFNINKNIHDARCLFEECNNLSYIEILENLPNLDSMERMCYKCESLESFNAPNLSLTNVTMSRDAFYNCKLLKNIDVSKWNFKNNKNISSMFYNCESLECLDVSKWNATRIEDMSYAFSGCTKIKTFDLSSWKTTNTKYMNGLFSSCYMLNNLIIPNFNLDNVIDYRDFIGKYATPNLKLENIIMTNCNESTKNKIAELFA